MTNLLIMLCSFFIILTFFNYIDLKDKKETIRILTEQYQNEISLNTELQNKIFKDKKENREIKELKARIKRNRKYYVELLDILVDIKIDVEFQDFIKNKYLELYDKTFKFN